MALSHGSNDGQKTMGIITLALFLFHKIPAIEVPFWVKVICASAIAFGTANGGGVGSDPCRHQRLWEASAFILFRYF